MTTGSLKQSWYRCALPALAAATLASGCASTSKTDVERARLRAFQGRLTETTESLQAGDVARARERLEEASSYASTLSERRKVESLDRLIAGTEAFMIGDADAARAEWSNIEDDTLREEVTGKARLVGLAVPDEPVETDSDSLQNKEARR